MISILWVLDWLEKNAPAGATFVAIPHGLGINYLTRHADPVRYTEFIPHVLQTYGNHKIAKQLEAAHPDYIVLVHVDTTEHGARFFGESPEYGAEVLAWINATFRPVYLAGSEPLQNEKLLESKSSVKANFHSLVGGCLVWSSLVTSAGEVSLVVSIRVRAVGFVLAIEVATVCQGGAGVEGEGHDEEEREGKFHVAMGANSNRHVNTREIGG